MVTVGTHTFSKDIKLSDAKPILIIHNKLIFKILFFSPATEGKKMEVNSGNIGGRSILISPDSLYV